MRKFELIEQPVGWKIIEYRDGKVYYEENVITDKVIEELSWLFG